MAGNAQLEALMLEAGYLREDGTVGLKVFGRAVEPPRRPGAEPHLRAPLAQRHGAARGEGPSRHHAGSSASDWGVRSASTRSGSTNPRTCPLTWACPILTRRRTESPLVTDLWQADLAGASDAAHGTGQRGCVERSVAVLAGVRTARCAHGTGSRRVGPADIAGIRSTPRCSITSTASTAAGMREVR